MDDGLKFSKVITAKEAERAKVARIALEAQDLSKPDSTAKAKAKAKAQRQQNQTDLIEDKPVRIKPPQRTIDLSGSKMKQELIKQGAAINNLTGAAKEKAQTN